MKRMMGKSFLLMLAAISVQTFAANMEFKVSGFTPGSAGSPALPETFDSINCEFEYQVDENNTFELQDFEMSIGSVSLGLSDVGTYSFGRTIKIGGLLTGVLGVAYGTDDFWFDFDPVAQTVSGFLFSTSEVYGTGYRGTQIDYSLGAHMDIVLDEEEGFYVPSEGGRVDYDVTLENFVPGEILNQWSVLTMPNGDEFPVHKLRERQVTGWDGSVEYNRNHLNIPEWFDDGEYKLTWYLANTDTLERTKHSMTFAKGEQALKEKQVLQSFRDALDAELKQNAEEEMKVVVEDGITRLIKK